MPRECQDAGFVSEKTLLCLKSIQDFQGSTNSLWLLWGRREPIWAHKSLPERVTVVLWQDPSEPRCGCRIPGRLKWATGSSGRVFRSDELWDSPALLNAFIPCPWQLGERGGDERGGAAELEHLDWLGCVSDQAGGVRVGIVWRFELHRGGFRSELQISWEVRQI